MHRPRDVTSQISALAEQLSYSSSIAIALYLITFFTIVGLAIFVYRRHRTSSLVYAPLNTPLELLPVVDRTASDLGVASKYSKKRMTTILARKARRVWARGKKKITFGTRKWGRRNKKVVQQWDLPQDDHSGYTDEESASEYEDEYEPKSRQPDAPALMIPITDHKAPLIDLSHIVQEDDIGEPNKHGLELVGFAPREQRLTAWPILTPTSSVSSNPSPHPSEDLVDLNPDDTVVLPFSRHKFPSVPTFPLLPSPPKTTPTASPLVTYKVPVLEEPYGLEMKHALPERRILTPPELQVIPVAKLGVDELLPLVSSGPTLLGSLSTERLAAPPSPPHTDVDLSPSDKSAVSESPSSSGPINALEVPVSLTSVPQELVNDNEALNPEEQVSSSPHDCSRPLPGLTPVIEDRIAAHDTISTGVKPLSTPSSVTEEALIASIQLSIDVPSFEPAGRPIVGIVAVQDYAYVDEDEDTHLIVEDMLVDSLTPLPSPLFPHSPEMRSALLTPEQTPLTKFVFSPPQLEALEIEISKDKRIQILIEDDSGVVSPPITTPSLSSPTLSSNEIRNDCHENNEQLGQEGDSYCSDPELPSLPSSPLNQVINFPVLIDPSAAAGEPSIPEVSISVPDTPPCGPEDPLAHSPIASSPPRPHIPPIQTPTPPPSPPGPNSPLPASPHPRVGTLVSKESESGSPLSPQSRPAWSLRAADSPALGLAVPPGKLLRSSPNVTPIPSPAIKFSTSLPGSFVEEPKIDSVPADPQPAKTSSEVSESALVVNYQPPRLRNLRSPVDIALAMQLRPGLGLGADPAWMVRFLMAMFGWMAVLVGQAGDF